MKNNSRIRTASTALTNAVSTRTSRTQHTALAVGSIAALGLANSILNSSYEASGHPVSYAEGQLAFNGETIKGYYAHMTNLGTLDTYVTTQLIDFGFIAAMVAIGVFLATRMARTLKGSRLAGLVSFAAILFVIGAGFDTIENLISFVMLANPESFADIIALPYSTAAALKFAAIVPAVCITAAALIVAAARQLRNLVLNRKSLAL